MAVARALGSRMQMLLAAGWLAIGMTVHNAARAVPYDPFVESGGRSHPWISDKLPNRVRQNIESAVELVVERLEGRPSCASLFTELGKDGVAVINRTLYYPANARMETKVCWRAYAFTEVGIRPTWICRRLWQLPVWRQALVLLHEALHHAGLEEWPHSKGAAHSSTVSGRVAAACGL